MIAPRSGTAPFEFVHRPDLHRLPDSVLASEVRLHGTFAIDQRPGFGQIYYALADHGLIRIDPDLKQQQVIPLSDQLRNLINIHSLKIGQIDGQTRLIVTANRSSLIAVVGLDGALDFVLSRPSFDPYQLPNTPFTPTDTLLVGDQLFVADGYGSNYISTYDLTARQWVGFFGGLTTETDHEDGKFATAHGLKRHHRHRDRLMIADRPNARIQEHGFDGALLDSHPLPSGAWPCGMNDLDLDGRTLTVIGSLFDPDRERRPAPIYILDADSDQVVSTVRPKEDLGIELADHLHNVIWYQHEGRVYLLCQSWNPGYYFVLERVS